MLFGCFQGNQFSTRGYFLLMVTTVWNCRGQDDYSFYELLPMAMLGAIGGLLGAIFTHSHEMQVCN